jgi:hypothetical protein
MDAARHKKLGVWLLCPEIRIGQFLATVAMLVEDGTGRSLGDIDDEELATALERFARDLSRRNSA